MFGWRKLRQLVCLKILNNVLIECNDDRLHL